MIEETKRESLYDISWQTTEEEYRKDPAYSYSTIAKFHREGFEKLSSLFDKVESPSLLFGSMVDTLLTGSQEEFDDNYLLAEFPELSDTMIDISKTAFRLYGKEYHDFNDIPDAIIASIGQQCDFWAADKWNHVRAKKIKEQNCKDYYELLHLAEGKTVITSKDYSDAIECVNLLKESDTTKWYFEPNNPFDNNIERFYQLKFKATLKTLEGDINVRCMMDSVTVDHDKKLIYPIDLKTSFKPEWQFYKSYLDWCYKCL